VNHPEETWRVTAKSDDNDKETCGRAIEALGRIAPADKDVLPSLVKALNKEDSSSREYAAEAVGRAGPAGKEAVPALLRCLEARNNELGVKAAEALANIGAEAALPRLVERMKTASNNFYIR
jgi:HEAT repeat protein